MKTKKVDFSIKNLTNEQKLLRKRILEISYESKFSHIGSCVSCVDIIYAMYLVKKNQDKIVLSNGHAGIALYTVLEKFGFLKKKDIEKFHIHPDRNKNLGIEVSTGSLGQGLPIALGMAMADSKKRIYCILSDGECSEGSIFESLKIANEKKVKNLNILINANGFGAYGKINLTNLLNQLRGFGFQVLVINGHDLNKIKLSLKKANLKPSIIFAQTTVNQFPFLNGLSAHYKVLSEKDYIKGMKLLR